MAKEVFPSTTKCCCKFELTRIIVAVYITVEIYFWAFVSLACIYTEFKMLENSRAFNFQNFTRHSTYYAIVFGSLKAPSGNDADDDGENVVNDDDGFIENDNEIGQGVIVTPIIFNGILVLVFVLYFFFAVILLIGISERNLSYFKLYLCLDTICLYFSLALAFFGILVQHHVLFRNAAIFAMKFYPATCTYSLYKQLGGPAITFRNFTQSLHHAPCITNSNPAIRLARSDTEFEESSITKSSDDFGKPHVSFQCDDDLQATTSEPNFSPSISSRGRMRKETQFKRDFIHLQLPVNNSYP